MKVQLLNTVENILAKGNITHNEQFCPLSQCFQKLSAAEASEKVCLWERVNLYLLHACRKVDNETQRVIMNSLVGDKRK